MISQILLFVVAIAVCANAYPQSRELTDDVAAFLGQLKVWPLCVQIYSTVSVLHSILQKAKSQQSLSRCSPFPFMLTFGGVTYEFRDCVGKIMQWKYKLALLILNDFHFAQ
jgi:hypothetical protein